MASLKRVPLSQKVRFEVFKRDLFICQYCGRKAPDVILEVDHINPVAKGGDNSIENLVTACRDCNRGKGDKKLSDLSEVEKSRRQLEELQEKKNMVDMIIQWKNGLNDTLSYQVNQIEQVFCSECGVDNEHFSESFKKLLRRSIRKYGFDLIIDAIYIAVDYYPTNNKQARENALSKIVGIAHNKYIEANDPEKASLTKVMHVACKLLAMSPREFYTSFPTNLYKSKQEKLILNAITATGSKWKFAEIVNQIYFGGTNG